MNTVMSVVKSAANSPLIQRELALHCARSRHHLFSCVPPCPGVGRTDIAAGTGPPPWHTKLWGVLHCLFAAARTKPRSRLSSKETNLVQRNLCNDKFYDGNRLRGECPMSDTK